ncbi:hypothetical protein D3C86_1960290 [compost metagenome]
MAKKKPPWLVEAFFSQDLDYQNAEYKATSKPTIINAPIANEVDTLNILASISSPLGTIPFLFS